MTDAAPAPASVTPEGVMARLLKSNGGVVVLLAVVFGGNVGSQFLASGGVEGQLEHIEEEVGKFGAKVDQAIQVATEHGAQLKQAVKSIDRLATSLEANHTSTNANRERVIRLEEQVRMLSAEVKALKGQ